MYVSPEIVVGFHGCDRSIAEKVIKHGEHLADSQNDYDWLGHGVYFWEGSYERAIEWAKASQRISEPSVVGAFIKSITDGCFWIIRQKESRKEIATTRYPYRQGIPCLSLVVI